MCVGYRKQLLLAYKINVHIHETTIKEVIQVYAVIKPHKRYMKEVYSGS